MKEHIRCFFTTMVCLGTFALYAGDDPCNATTLSTSNSDFLFFDNNGNSDSGVEAPVIGGYTGSDIWFSFTMTAGELILLIQEGGMLDPAVAIYSGDCNDPLLIYNVIDNNCDGDVNPELLISELTPGETYFIRVWAQDGSSNGSFSLFLGSDVPSLLDFEVFADASIIGDCIELTAEQNGQQGCAWYQLQVDFSQPFTHEMTANFGDQDASGADGICLVYQSNGPDFCGAIGGGIGALGMPNSAIFEFDTWQNGIYSDPAQDHVAFNVNGNMSHPSSIDGPITLGNIEDGADHTILFNWDPAGNFYELFFDGTLVLSGSYDIINNCFGGNNLAYWGYTSSTGGANNNHIICPLVLEYNPALVSYEEVTLCAGESYNGWTESGFYIQEVPGANGCTHQIHTRLTIAEESEPYFLEKYICDGEIFAVEGDFFMDEGIYTINTLTTLGCDSTIILDLKVIIPTLEIIGGTDFTCDTESIILTLEFDINYPIVDVDYFWQTPNGSSQSDFVEAITPGSYSVIAFINYEDVLCLIDAQIELFIDTIPPVLENIPDLTILCNTPVEDWILEAPESQDDLIYTWYLDGTYLGMGTTLAISEEGIYTLEAQDLNNGCTSSIEAQVFIDGDIPQIEMAYDSLQLNCLSTEHIITPTVTYQEPGDIVWTSNSNIISNDTTITVNTPGTYIMMITDINGCSVIDSITISQDTIAPVLFLDDIIIPCDQNDTLINAITLTTNTIAIWEGPQEINNPITPLINTAGLYSVTITDTTNYCSTNDIMNIVLLGPSPEVEIIGDDILDCNIISTEIIVSLDQNNATVNWYNSEGILLTDSTSLIVDIGDTYIAEVISATGCITIDSTLITQDIIAPFLILDDIIIPCDQTDTLINPITFSNNTVADWESPQILNDGITPLISTAGLYSITLTDTTNYCTTSGNMIVDLLGPSPEISISGDDTLNCIIESAEIIATINQNDATLNWFNSVSFLTNDPIINVNTPDLYIVQAFSSTGCSTIDSFELIEHKIYPTTTLESDTIDCDNLQATINAGIMNGTIDSWVTPQNNNPSTSSITTDISGTYILNAINIETGCVTTDSIEVLDHSNPPIYTFTSNTITCVEPSVALNLDISSIYESILWTYPNATTSNELSPTTSIDGIYNLHIEVEGFCDLDTIIEIDIDTISPSYLVDFGIIDCSMNNTFLNLNNANNIESIIITSPTNVVYNDIENTVDEGGLYSISTIGTNGCTASSSVEILSFTTIPEITIQQDLLVSCNEPTATIIATSTSSNIDYTWTDDQTFIIGNTNTITVNSGGVYVLDIIDENGCENIYNVVIEEKLEQPDINLMADNITCNNTTSTIILESQTELTDIAWSDANGVVSSDDQLAVYQGGWYYVQGSNQYGCETDDSILVLENIDTPVLDLLSPDTTILLPNGSSDILIDEFSSGNVDFRWMPTEGLSCSDCLEPTITEYLHDSYQLTATNEYGCITTITIHVREKKLTSVTIPNIFSPSSRDGNNDLFTLYGNENVVLINEMYVYDRWGNLVYSNNNFPPNDPYQGWDGLFKGESVVNGVYVYLFRVTTNEGEVLTFTGDVTKI